MYLELEHLVKDGAKYSCGIRYCPNEAFLAITMELWLDKELWNSLGIDFDNRAICDEHIGEEE